jgi:hypothetical protein
MKTHGKDLTLRLLAIQSLLAFSLGVVMPFIAMFEGKKIEGLSSLAFLSAGCLGMAAYQSITKVMERIDELESRTSEIRKLE